jgi:uncharacterized protein (TIGR02646 family)
MRYIKKQQTPPKFTEWKAQANEAWQPFWNSKSTNFQNPQKEIVHKSLLKEQGYICCYCQRRIDLNNSHIEHFKPKDENYYPELSLEYTNFLASCQKEKINIETSEEKIREYGEIPVHCGHAKGNWYDEKLTVSPLLQNCTDYFRYTEAGEILPSEDPDKNEAAKVTIEKLGLDKLNDKRQAVIKGLFGEEKLSKEEIEIFINNLDQRNPEDQYDEFCNVLIYVLKQYI